MGEKLVDVWFYEGGCSGVEVSKSVSFIHG